MDEIEYNFQISKVFTEILNSNLPKNWIAGNGSSGMNFDARLSNENRNYKSSDYYYNGEMKFVHWTTVQNLLSIINSRQVRLYNLQSSADPEEFEYAAKQLSITNNSIDHSKNHLYTFSFSEISESDNQHHWKTYGKNYSGVSIEFEIRNNPENWVDFMLAPIQYELPEKIKKFIDELKALEKKHTVIKTEIDLGRLIAFHKNPSFRNEREIRLSSYYPFDSIPELLNYCNTEFRLDNNRPRITNYFGLELWVDIESFFIKEENIEYYRQNNLEHDYYIKKPEIVITNINIGEDSGITHSKYHVFKAKLEEVIRLKLGYKVTLPLNLYKKT